MYTYVVSHSLKLHGFIQFLRTRMYECMCVCIIMYEYVCTYVCHVRTHNILCMYMHTGHCSQERKRQDLLQDEVGHFPPRSPPHHPLHHEVLAGGTGRGPRGTPGQQPLHERNGVRQGTCTYIRIWEEGPQNNWGKTLQNISQNLVAISLERVANNLYITFYVYINVSSVWQYLID